MAPYVNDPKYLAAFQQLLNGWPNVANEPTKCLRVCTAANKLKDNAVNAFVFFIDSLVSALRNEEVT